MVKEKGILELIEAMCMLRDYRDIYLMVIGSPFYGNTSEIDEFGRLLIRKSEPIKDRIHFTGFVAYHQMPTYLQQADVAVIPSVWDDPFPTTVLEAQAMGLPIITTCRGGIPEEVSEENAVILPTDSDFSNRIAKAILDLYQDPDRRHRMAKASVQRSTMFTKQKYAQNFFRSIDMLTTL